LAGVVVGASVCGAVWLYTYRNHDVIRFIDTNGVEYNDPRHVSVQPWWGVYAALALIAVAIATTVRLLPDDLPQLKRFRRVLSSRTQL
jgi:hypothetical protein